MRRIIIFLLSIILNNNILAQEIEIPEGIKYKKASLTTNEKAQNTFLSSLKNNDTRTIFGDLCYVGPNLWERYSKNTPLKSEIKGGEITFNVPKFDSNGKLLEEKELYGKLIQKSEHFNSLWHFIQKDLNGTVHFKKLSPLQLKYYWSIIFYDIEEPVFIADNGKHKLLIQFSPSSNKILWIDEVF